MIRLMVCDDHQLVREGLIYALRADVRFAVVAEASSRAEVTVWLEQGTDDDVDVAVIDLNLDASGVRAGLELLDAIRTARPKVGIVVLSMHDDAAIVSSAMQAGAMGYVSKDSTLHVLMNAIVQVSSGHHFLAPRLVEPMVRQQGAKSNVQWDAALTKREKDVLCLICAGQRLSDIANTWGVSVKTVSTHKARLMDKLAITSNTDLIKLCVRRGLT